jgi:hypothetical protein
VSKALSEEIRYVCLMVDEFKKSISSEEHFLNKYKTELLHHVEKELGSKLHATLSTEFVKYIKKSQREMTGNK